MLSAGPPLHTAGVGQLVWGMMLAKAVVSIAKNKDLNLANPSKNIKLFKIGFQIGVFAAYAMRGTF